MILTIYEIFLPGLMAQIGSFSDTITLQPKPFQGTSFSNLKSRGKTHLRYKHTEGKSLSRECEKSTIYYYIHKYHNKEKHNLELYFDHIMTIHLTMEMLSVLFNLE